MVILANPGFMERAFLELLYMRWIVAVIFKKEQEVNLYYLYDLSTKYGKMHNMQQVHDSIQWRKTTHSWNLYDTIYQIQSEY